MVGGFVIQGPTMDEPEADIESIDVALRYATADAWRTWYDYVDKLLDQRLEATR
jgi:hypothetical protein